MLGRDQKSLLKIIDLPVIGVNRFQPVVKRMNKDFSVRWAPAGRKKLETFYPVAFFELEQGTLSVSGSKFYLQELWPGNKYLVVLEYVDIYEFKSGPQ